MLESVIERRLASTHTHTNQKTWPSEYTQDFLRERARNYGLAQEKSSALHSPIEAVEEHRGRIYRDRTLSSTCEHAWNRQLEHGRS